MKELADGTFVSDDTPTKNISGLRYLLSTDDIAKRQAEEAAWLAEKIVPKKADVLEVRLAALEAKIGITDQDKLAAKAILEGK